MAKSAIELARQVLDDATRYEQYFADNGLAAPSFGPEAFPEPDLPPHILATRHTLLTASYELQDLVRGPKGIVNSAASYHPHLMAMQAIYRYDLIGHVPSHSSISYSELSEKCHLRQSEVKRVLRYAMGCHMFYEPEPEYVAHNGASKALAETHSLKQWFGMVIEELWPAATRTVDAMQKWPGSEEKAETGFQLAHNTTNSIYAEMTLNHRRAQRFAEAMSLFSNAPGFEVSHVVNAFPWGEIKGGSFTFVDVGGSLGTVDIALARAFPKAIFVVQDLPQTISKASIPDDLNDRLSFFEHDFFTLQTVSADIYLLRWILHDWADSYCVKILQALIPALKPGSRVVVNEFCLPQPGQASAYKYRYLRAFDLTMLSIQNSKERDLDEWKLLFRDADPRFQFQKVHVTKNSLMALIEFMWSG